MNICVIAAHPDDEILGCGATIAKHVASGDKVSVLIVAEGLTSRNLSANEVDSGLADLRRAARKANDIVGTSNLTFFGLPDNKLDTIPRLDLVQKIENYLRNENPDIIYTHYQNDLNIDHQLTYAAVMTACRPIFSERLKAIYSFEVPSSTEWTYSDQFQPNHYVGVEENLETKLKSLLAYESEMRPWPHPRSLEAVEHLARWRGASIGQKAAEAFRLVRSIE